MKKLLYIAVLALVVVSCKKEPLPDLPPETGPYYSIQGYINNDEIDLNVGQEGILISHGVEYVNGIKSYYGQIVSPSEDLLIKVEFTKPEAPLTAAGLNAITDGGIDYLVHQPGCLSPSFGSNQMQTNFLLIKNELGNFEPVTEVEFEEFGLHELTMKFTDVGQNSFQIPVNYGFDPMMLNPKFSTFPSADSVIFSAVTTAGTHEWYVDGNLISTEVMFTHQLPIGVHVVEHKLRDANNNEANHVTLVRITDYVLDWQMEMNNCGSLTNHSNYGKVTVTVLTNGKIFKSNQSTMNHSNSFSVDNIEYIGNSSGAPVRAVFDLAFDAMLVDQTGTDSLSLVGMTGTFNIGLQ